MRAISKTRFIAGAQCARRFWLESERPELAAPPDRATQERFARGTRIGELARDYFGGGRLVGASAFESARRATDEALSDAFLPAIYEGAFEHEGVVIRADILARADVTSWDLIEVKSGHTAREVFELDLAVQHWVVRGAGVRLRRAGLLLVREDFTGDPEDADLKKLFAFHDLTAACEQRMAEVADRVAFLKSLLAAGAEPDIATGAHCHRPYDCPFLGHCSR